MVGEMVVSEVKSEEVRELGQVEEGGKLTRGERQGGHAGEWGQERKVVRGQGSQWEAIEKQSVNG